MDKRTIQTYNQMAIEYDNETADFWDKFPPTFLNKFAELSKSKILDIGCGPGRDALLLSKRNKKIIGLDASQTMVEICNSKGIKAVFGDFNNIPFKDNSFDGAWVYTSLLHVKKSQITVPLKEIKRILKKGGIFALGMIEGDVEEYRVTSGVSKPRLFSFYTKSELEKLLNDNGFEIIYFEIFKPKTKNYLNFISRKV